MNIFFELNMGLLTYFKRASIKKQSKVDCVSPKLDGLLSQIMPMSSIQVANAAICHVMMNVQKLKEIEEMDCNEEVVC